MLLLVFGAIIACSVTLSLIMEANFWFIKLSRGAFNFISIIFFLSSTYFVVFYIYYLVFSVRLLLPCT